jgi:hypothetical protein
MKISVIALLAVLGFSSLVMAESISGSGLESRVKDASAQKTSTPSSVSTTECRSASREIIMAGFDDVSARDRRSTRENRVRCKFGAVFFRNCAAAYIDAGDMEGAKFSMEEARRVETAQYMNRCKN